MSQRATGESSTVSLVREEPLKLLVEVGLLLGRERDFGRIADIALQTGLRLCGAESGVFLYPAVRSGGEDELAFRATGLEAAELAAVGTSGAVKVLTEVIANHGLLHSPDIATDRRFAEDGDLAGLVPQPSGLRSYLAVPVRGSSDEILGVLIYGDSEPASFDPACESAIETLASQVAAALGNARLAEILSREAAQTEAAREEVRSTTNRLRQALDAAQLGTWTWEKATDLLDLDQRAAELLDAPAHTPIARTELRKRILAPEDSARTPEDLGEALVSTMPYSTEYRVDHGDHELHWIASRGIATFLPGTQQVQGMTGTVQDITARRAQEEALRQSEKLAATGRLAATIAHEINNPLESVTNLIYIAKTEPSVDGYVKGLLETADTELARVAQITQQTLGFYRDTTRPAHVDLHEVLHGVVTLFARKLNLKNLECHLDLGPNIHIFGLQGEVRQVFSNLLVNAIDASSKGVIRVRARRRRRRGTLGVSVLIADQGSGIPHHVRGRLFAPFFTTKSSVGTGLGLWVTRGMVEKHGGSVRFRSCTDVPSGTVFHVFLPAEARHENSFSSPQSSFVH